MPGRFLEQFPTVFQALNQGFLQTLRLFAVTLLGAIPLGLLICIGSMSRFKPLSWLLRGIIWIVRGSPLMIQLIIIFYFPGMVFGNNIWGTGEAGRSFSTTPAIFPRYTARAFRASRTGRLRRARCWD